MAVKAFFHRNVFLLNQLVPPSDDFKKVFREGMFNKPNMAGFIEVSHYLLTIYDAERFKKLIEWPIMCKKMEAKYRNDVRDYLSVIATENPDIGFPNILVSYLHHASGLKFTIIMDKLSLLVLKRYIMRKGEHVVISLPRLGTVSDLSKTYLQQSKADIASNILSRHRNCTQMEKDIMFILEETKEQLAKIKAELFDRKQSLMKCATAAPIQATSMKQCLTNIEDSEIMQMWKNSIDKNIRYIQKKHDVLNNLKKGCENVNSIILNLSSNAKALDGKQLEEVECSQISEVPFPPDIQHCLHHLYNDDKLVYHNFIRLLTSTLHQVHQYLRKGGLSDLSQCLLQVEASVEDTKSVHNMFQTFSTSMIDATKETQSVLCGQNVGHVTSRENALPFVKNVLLMPTPLIKINTSCANDKNDLFQISLFTPERFVHKSLFSRYARHNQNDVPDLKMNLFISRLNVDNAMLFDNNDKQKSLSVRSTIPKVNRLCKRPAVKFSRLFPTRMHKTAKVNSSMLSLPSTARANSSAIASTIGKTPEFNLSITAKNFFNLSEESFISSRTLSPIKRDASPIVSQEQAEHKPDHEVKVNKLELDEFTEIQLTNDENKATVQEHANAPRRQSISDLVERYKKLMEVSNSVTKDLQDKYILHESN